MEIRTVEQLKQWQKNPRSIDRSGAQRLREQLLMGQHSTLLITPDGTILGGNQRYAAMKALVMESKMINKIKCFVVDFKIDQSRGYYAVLEGEEIRTKYYKTKEDGMMEYSLSHNDRAGFYVEDLVKGMMKDFNIDWSKYSIDLNKPITVSQSMAPDVKEDEPPSISVLTPISKLGEVYQLGKHRLMCGDSTKGEDVEKLMNGNKSDMIFTDPPYGVGYADKNIYLNSIDKGNRIQAPIENDHMDINETSDFIYKSFVQIKENLKEDGSYYITAPQGGDLMMMMMMMMQKAGIPLRHCLIWVKNNHVLGRTDYNYKHEPILYGWIEKHNFYGGGKHLFSTWEIDKPVSNDLHPTMKPVALMANAILNSSKEGDVILDIFGGSGSTLIACEQLKRTCYMMEIAPVYCDVIRKRYAKFIGKENEWQTITPAI